MLLAVASEHAPAAASLLQRMKEEAMSREELAAARHVVDFDAPEASCPACGARFATSARRCPECGLNFG